MADITRGTLVSTGVMAVPSIDEAPQEDHFGYVFEGLIRIPERGVWEFFTRSDDGSVLLIDGCKVVDNDSSHAAVTATGAWLSRRGCMLANCSISKITRGRSSNGAGKLPARRRSRRFPLKICS